MLYTKKIYTANNLKLLRGSQDNTFKKRLSYQLKTNKLTKIRKWIYVTSDQIYNLEESDYRHIANSISLPSYISFETVLRDHGVIFQMYISIFVAANYTKEIKIEIPQQENQIKIQFQKLPIEILSNPLWLETENWYSIASLERALCDILRKQKEFYFDNLDSEKINITKLEQIADFYNIYKLDFKENLFHKLAPYGITTTIST